MRDADHRIIIRRDSLIVERRDGVEGRWETAMSEALTPEEGRAVDRIVEAARLRRERGTAARRLADLDAERARLMAILASDSPQIDCGDAPPPPPEKITMDKMDVVTLACLIISGATFFALALRGLGHAIAASFL